jgi:hypothetical protein
LRHYATSRKVAGLCPDEVDLFQFTEFFQPHYGSGVDSASNRNDYQECSWRVKGGRDVLKNNERWEGNTQRLRVMRKARFSSQRRPRRRRPRRMWETAVKMDSRGTGMNGFGMDQIR